MGGTGGLPQCRNRAASPPPLSYDRPRSPIPNPSDHGGLLSFLRVRSMAAGLCFKWTAAMAVVAGGLGGVLFLPPCRRGSPSPGRGAHRQALPGLEGHASAPPNWSRGKGSGSTICRLSSRAPRGREPSCSRRRGACGVFDRLEGLVRATPDVRRVTVRRPVLRVTRRPDGTWSAAKLLPPPHLRRASAGGRQSRAASIEIFDPLRASTSHR